MNTSFETLVDRVATVPHTGRFCYSHYIFTSTREKPVIERENLSYVWSYLQPDSACKVQSLDLLRHNNMRYLLKRR